MTSHDVGPARSVSFWFLCSWRGPQHVLGQQRGSLGNFYTGSVSLGINPGRKGRWQWQRPMTMKVSLVVAVLVAAAPTLAINLERWPELSRTLTPSASAEVQTEAVQQLIHRLIPSRSSEFNARVDPSLAIGSREGDTFSILKIPGVPFVEIVGSTGVAASMGFLHYLKYFCYCHVSWEADQLNLPDTLPSASVAIVTNDRLRYYQNVCTVSYSFAWWDWSRWEREIDWMAMNGINMPLAFTGQEAIWEAVLLRLNLTQHEIDAFFAGPAFLAWGRMGNIRGWGGPLSSNWHHARLQLQKKILARMRSLGMLPVLPAFAGHVPAAFERVFPNASLTRLKSWNSFSCNYSCTYLMSPTDPLFQQVGAMFMKEMISQFGTDHLYNCDTFNEMRPQSSDPKYLGAVGKATFDAMNNVDPKAIWVMQGWLFHHDFTFWNSARAQAYLTSAPIGRIIVLDLQSELSPQFWRLKSYFGQPFIWCMLQNFGGTLGLYGSIDRVNMGPFEARKMENSSMIGTGLTPEGINQNYVIFDLMNEMAWRNEPVILDDWMAAYAMRRYGNFSEEAAGAWKILKKGVYNYKGIISFHGKHLLTKRPKMKLRTMEKIINCITYAGNGQYVFVKRPQLQRTEPLWYDVKELVEVWGLLVNSSETLGHQPTFRHDLVDVTREVLQNLAALFYKKFTTAFTANKTQAFEKNAGLFLSALNDMETILASEHTFLLGRWLSDAKSIAETEQDMSLFEYNARNQITLWGPKGEIVDYATKQWSGVVSHYYIPRWRLFIARLRASLGNQSQFDQGKFNADVFRKVEQPFTFDTNVFPTEPQGDSVAIAKYLHKQWIGTFGPKTLKQFRKNRRAFEKLQVLRERRRNEKAQSGRLFLSSELSI